MSIDDERARAELTTNRERERVHAMIGSERTKPARAAGTARRSDRGTAMIISVMVMSLLAIFVAAALNRVTSEARVMSNDYERSRAFYAAQASLEVMSRDFARIFITKYTPVEPPAANDDITPILADTPNIAGMSFVQRIRRTGSNQVVTL